MIAPVFSGVAETGAARHATVLATWNDLKFEFLRETDFGSVITVKRNVLEDGKEITLELAVVAGFFFVFGEGGGGGSIGKGAVFHGAEEKREVECRRAVQN